VSEDGPRRIVLVGFMGAGKSSVGAAVARRLGWRFVDVDDVVEREAGAAVAEIFALHGEERFRRLEEETTRRILLEDRVVVGTGGGWAAVSGRLDALDEGTATFWLQVTPETAVARAEREPGRRPLLAGADALERATELLAARVDFYGRARWAVDTERSTVEDVSARILHILVEEYPSLRLHER
jgi:shikimate kinase